VVEPLNSAIQLIASRFFRQAFLHRFDPGLESSEIEVIDGCGRFRKDR